MKKTSENSPIRVDWIPTPEASARGSMGITFAPGKQTSGGGGVRWDRDLVADLERLRDAWKVDVLITLVPDDELRRLKIGNLGREAKARGFSWRHFPIPDVSAPQTSLDAAEVLAREVIAGIDSVSRGSVDP